MHGKESKKVANKDFVFSTLMCNHVHNMVNPDTFPEPWCLEFHKSSMVGSLYD